MSTAVPADFRVSLALAGIPLVAKLLAKLNKLPVLRKLKCWLRLVVKAICTPRGENPTPKATLENGRGDQDVMAGAGAGSGTILACPPPGMASKSRELTSELEDCATRVEVPTSKASTITDFLVFTIRNPL